MCQDLDGVLPWKKGEENAGVNGVEGLGEQEGGAARGHVSAYQDTGYIWMPVRSIPHCRTRSQEMWLPDRYTAAAINISSVLDIQTGCHT